MDPYQKARSLLKEFKGESYVYGTGVLSRVGEITAGVSERPVLIRSTFPGTDDLV
ncbi:MAG: hypothetical protein R6U51_06690 [Anaerolineales bacterium]